MKQLTTNPYQAEASEKWGDTQAYKESVQRVKKMGKAGLAQVLAEADRITAALATHVAGPVDHPEVIVLIQAHRTNLGNFYTVTDELYAGLAELYVSDPRFKKHYDDIMPGLADFLSRAMRASLRV